MSKSTRTKLVLALLAGVAYALDLVLTGNEIPTDDGKQARPGLRGWKRSVCEAFLDGESIQSISRRLRLSVTAIAAVIREGGTVRNLD